jgi:hypothetical protein
MRCGRKKNILLIAAKKKKINDTSSSCESSCQGKQFSIDIFNVVVEFTVELFGPASIK